MRQHKTYGPSDSIGTEKALAANQPDGKDEMPIVIEAENPDDPRSMLRIICAGTVRGENLTAAQAYVLLGQILENLYPSRWDRG